MITKAARAVLPVWKTTPNRTLCRDAGLPTAEDALEKARARMALRINTVPKGHPLEGCAELDMRLRGRGARTPFPPRTRMQTVAQSLPKRPPRKLVLRPRWTPGCRINPTNGLSKEDAAKAFTAWYRKLEPRLWPLRTGQRERTE